MFLEQRHASALVAERNMLRWILGALAVALCGLTIYHWRSVSNLREDLEKYQAATHSQQQAITNAEVALARQAEGLEAKRREFGATTAAQETQLKELLADLDSAQQKATRFEAQNRVYKEGIDKANANIVKQNEQLRAQNEALKKMAAERNEGVVKYNKLAADYNELARKWNRQQEELRQAAAKAGKQ